MLDDTDYVLNFGDIYDSSDLAEREIKKRGVKRGEVLLGVTKIITKPMDLSVRPPYSWNLAIPN